jgi:hypothetical protein
MNHHHARFALRALCGLAFASALHAQGIAPAEGPPAAASAPEASASMSAPARKAAAKASRRASRSNALAVALDVTLAPNAKVDPELEADCKFEELLATDASKALRHARLGGVKPSGHDERLLKVQITDVSGESGGVYTGTKSMRVHVALVVDGKVSDETDFYRYNTGGNPFRGTCHIIRQHTKRLGRDLAGWVKDENFRAEDAPMGDSDESAE